MSLKEEIAARLNKIIKDKYANKPGRLAKLAGISPGLFTTYVEGVSIPGGENLIRIQKASKISIDWLLTGKEPKLTPEVSKLAEVLSYLHTNDPEEFKKMKLFLYRFMDIYLGEPEESDPRFDDTKGSRGKGERS